MMNKLKKVLIIGPGSMGSEYSKCLEHMKCEVHVLGRTNRSFDNFKSSDCVYKYTDISDFIKINKVEEFDLAIVAVSVEALLNSSILAIKTGIKRILIEKPAGLYKSDIAKLIRLGSKYNSQIYIAYNRRYYGSVQKAMNIIENDGGPLSAHFDFTEWEDSVLSSGLDTRVLSRWFFANSTHILDTIFFLIGPPKELNFYGRKELDWHTGNSILAGSGISSKKALFSFHSNWNSAGRWSMEILTKNHKIIFCPIEDLKIMKKNSIDIKEYKRDQNDIDFKPGLYNQINDLLQKNPKFGCLIKEHADHWDIYEDLFNRRKSL